MHRAFALLLMAAAVCACSRAPEPAPAPAPVPAAVPAPVPAPATAIAIPARDPHFFGWVVPAAEATAVQVDVLVRADAIAMDAETVERSAAAAVANWRALPEKPQVVTVARDGELRAVIRFAAATAVDAEKAVETAWQAADSADFATPTVAAIPRGNRARAAWAFAANGGDVASTVAAEQAAQSLLPRFGMAYRLVLAGAVRPVLFADVLTKTLRDRRVALADVVGLARSQLLQPQPAAADDVAQQAALGNLWSKGQLAPARTAAENPLPPVALGDLLAIRRGLGEPGLGAWVGRNAAPVLLVEAGGQANEAAIAKQDLAFRAETQGSPEVIVQPLSVGLSRRWLLRALPNKPPENAGALAQRLLAVRQMPGVVAALAVGGVDGVPAALQPEAIDGEVVTVWVSLIASAPNAVSADAVAAKLSEGPWQVAAMPDSTDAALTWAALSVPLLRIGVMYSEAPPPDRPAAATHLRWNYDAVRGRQVAPNAVALADRLLRGAVQVGQIGRTRVWLTLPKGVMLAEQGKLPLGFAVQGSAMQPIMLDDLLQTPPPVWPNTADLLAVNGTRAKAVPAAEP